MSLMWAGWHPCVRTGNRRRLFRIVGLCSWRGPDQSIEVGPCGRVADARRHPQISPTRRNFRRRQAGRYRDNMRAMKLARIVMLLVACAVVLSAAKNLEVYS